MHYYERNIGDYYRKAGRLNILQHGVYTLLMDACYDREKFPTLEDAIDWVWAESDEEIEAVKFVLRKFFKLNEEGVYVQNHIEEDLIAYKAFLQKQTENGKKGGRPPKQKPSDNVGNENNGLGESGLGVGTEEKPTETQKNPEKPNLTQEKPKPPTNKPSNQEPNKKTRSKEFDPLGVDLPGNVNREAWEGYVSMRSSIKKPLTERATTLVLNKLTEFGKFADIALDNSTVNNWQDVFMPKDETKPIGLPKSRPSPPNQTYQPRFGNQNQQRDNTVIQGEYRDV